MTLDDIKTKLEDASAKVYGAAVAFLTTKVIPTLEAGEAAVVELVTPILQAGEKTALADLKVAAETFVKAAATDLNKGLPALEEDFLNVLSATKPELLAVAKQVGSQAIQSILGLLIAKLATSAV